MPLFEGLFAVPYSERALDRDEIAKILTTVDAAQAVDELPARVGTAIGMRGFRDHLTVTPQQVIESGESDFSCPDVATARSYQTINRGFRDQFDVLASDDPLAQLHSDEFAKGGPEYGSPGGWDIIRGMSHERPVPSLPDSGGVALLLEAMAMATAASAVKKKKTVRRGTNHGLPTGLTSDVDHVAHFAMTAHLIDDYRQKKGGLTAVERRISQFHRRAGFSSLFDGSAATLLTRSGPNRKPQLIWRATGEKYAPYLEVTGVFPRRRFVRAVPTWLNEMLRSDWDDNEVGVETLTNRLKESYLGHCFRHGKREVTQALISTARTKCVRAFGDAVVVNDDASNFDDSVGARLMRWAYDQLPYGPGHRDLFQWAMTLPVLTGPDNVGGLAGLRPRIQGVMSGIIDTSFFDSWLNWLVAATSLRQALGMQESAFYAHIARGEITLLVQGDDTLIIAPPFDVDAYSRAAATMGFSRTPGRGPLFLKTWYGPLGWHNLASRAAVRSQTRERRAAGVLTEQLGVLARWTLASGDPYGPEIWRGLRAVSPLDLPTTPSLLRTRLRKHGRELIAELKSGGPPALASALEAIAGYETNVADEAAIRGFALLEQLLGERLPVLRPDQLFIERGALVERARTFDVHRYLDDLRSRDEQPRWQRSDADALRAARNQYANQQKESQTDVD